jgi:hypothetical protein
MFWTSASLIALTVLSIDVLLQIHSPPSIGSLIVLMLAVSHNWRQERIQAGLRHARALDRYTQRHRME